MRTLPLLGALLALAGCSDDVCAKYGGKTCIALDVRGGAGTTLSTLHVVATSGFTLDSLDSRPDNAVLALPVTVAIVPAEFGGDFTLDVTAQLGSSVVGQTVVSGSVEAKKHIHLVAELDAPPIPDMAPPPDLSGADMASSDLALDIPADSECGNVSTSWVTDMKDAQSCAARHAGPVDVSAVSSDFLVADVDHVHIASNDASKRVGIVAKAEGGPDNVALLVSQFTDGAWPPTYLTTTYGGENEGDRQGTSASIAVGGDGVHLCFLDTSDSGNEIHHALVDTTGGFGTPETVATGQGTSGEVAIALESSGKVVCAYYDATDFNVYANVRAAGTSGAWGTTPTRVLTGSMPPDGVGSVALLSTGSGAELAGQITQFTGSALPQFASYDGTTWSMPKSIDNMTPNGVYGQDVHLAHLGSLNAESYFIPNGANWDLRVATFSSASDTPVYATIYPSAATTQTGAQHAIAYDTFGLLHVALITPNTTDTTTASLLYLRQYPDGKGGYTWLTDLVDSMAGGGDEGVSSVDLVVDSNNRPHITYYSGERGRVMYATRTDRP